MKTIPAKRLIASLEAMGLLKRLDAPNERYGFQALWEILPGELKSGRILIQHVQGICSESGHRNGHRFWWLFIEGILTPGRGRYEFRSAHAAIAFCLNEVRTVGTIALTTACLQSYLDNPNELPLPKPPASKAPAREG